MSLAEMSICPVWRTPSRGSNEQGQENQEIGLRGKVTWVNVGGWQSNMEAGLCSISDFTDVNVVPL